MNETNRIKIKNIYYMLAYAYTGLRDPETINAGTEEFDHIHDLLAKIIVLAVSDQFKKGLYRSYSQTEEVLSQIKGKLLLSESLKMQTIPTRRLVCSYDEFKEDNVHNQIIKATMLLLLRNGYVKSEIRKEIRLLLDYLSMVKDISLSSALFNTIAYHRFNASYEMLIGICALVVRGLLQQTEAGSYKLLDWIQEEQMYRLFERFVLGWFQKHHPEFSPVSTIINWDLNGKTGDEFLPKMKTDITLKNEDKILIIDTKFYADIYSSHNYSGQPKFNSNNLYQIYSYVKNQDVNHTGRVSGVLLYAHTDEEIQPDSAYIMDGNAISLKSINLNVEFKFIAAKLESLCKSFGEDLTLEESKAMTLAT